MNDAITNLTTEQHRNTAAALFNYTWELIESPDKKQDTIDEMINVAHASCFHWLKAGNPVNQARGHWLISRVYSIVNRIESATYHGERCLDICLKHHLGAFDLGFAYESIARVANTEGSLAESNRYITLGIDIAHDIEIESDRDYLIAELEKIKAGR